MQDSCLIPAFGCHKSSRRCNLRDLKLARQGDYSSDLVRNAVSRPEPHSVASRISDREKRQLENTNLRCRSCIMYMLRLRVRSFTNTSVPIPARTRTVSGRVEGCRSVRSITHISRFPQEPVKALHGRGRPSHADTDLVSIVEKYRQTDNGW
jgi:hypothetical protein